MIGKYRYVTIRSWAALLSLAAGVSCTTTTSSQDSAPHHDSASTDEGGSPRPMLSLTGARVPKAGPDGAARVRATVAFKAAAAGAARPRIAELFVRADDGLAFESFEAGDAVAASEKVVRVQPQEDGTLRVVILAKNIEPFHDGPLVSLVFRETRAAGHRLEALTGKQIFAPAKANEGLLVSDPVTIP